MMSLLIRRTMQGLALAAAALLLLPSGAFGQALAQTQAYLGGHGVNLEALQAQVVEPLVGPGPHGTAGTLAELALLRLCGFVLAAPGQYALWLAAAYSLASGLCALSLHRHDYTVWLHVLPRAAAVLRWLLLAGLPLLLLQTWWCDARLFHGYYLVLVTCLGVDAAFRTGARSL